MLYFYCTDETEDIQGPVSAGELKRLFSEGLLSPQARVCPEGGDVWRHIQEVIRTLVSVPAPPAARKTTATSSPAPLVYPPPLPSSTAAIPASHVPPLPFATSRPASAAPPSVIVTRSQPHLGSWLLALFLACMTTAAIVIPIIAYLDREEVAHRMKLPDWVVMPMVSGILALGAILTFVYGMGLQSMVVNRNTSTSAGPAGQPRSQNPQKPVAFKVTVRQELYIIFGTIALAAFILLLVYLS